MRWVWRGLLLLAVVIIGAGIWGYWKVIGRPFSFNAMLNTQMLERVFDYPQELTSVGVMDGSPFDFHSGKLDPYSLDFQRREYDATNADEAQIKTWDKTSLSPQEQLSYDIVLWADDRALAGRKYPWLAANGQAYPVNQAFGIQKDLPNFLLSQHQITNAKLARNYVERLKAMSAVLGYVDADVARQAKMGVVPPDFVVDDNIRQMRALIAPGPAANVLVTNLATK